MIGKYLLNRKIRNRKSKVEIRLLKIFNIGLIPFANDIVPVQAG
jgi:hypothetical protein